MTPETFAKEYGGKVRSYKGGWLIQCPLGTHRDNTPSFSLSTNGLFNCWSCGATGNFTRLLHDVAGFSWKKSTATVVDLGLKEYWHERAKKAVYGQEEPKTINSAVLGLFDVNWEEAYAVYKANVSNCKKRPPWALVFDKGFLPDTLEAFDAGYDSDDQRITIPIWNRYDKLVGILGRACRAGEFKYVPYLNFQYTSSVYNLQNTEEGEAVVLVEGAFDVWMLHQWKIPFTAIATMTSHMSEAQAVQILEKHSHILLFYDNDKAGWRGATAAAKLLTKRGGQVDIVGTPEDISDIKEMNARSFNRQYEKRKLYPCQIGS